MNKFCEECGALLKPGLAFCEECGARAPVEQITQPIELEQKEKQGIILTHIPLLAKETGQSEDHIRHSIVEYIQLRKTHGDVYRLVDLAEAIPFSITLPTCSEVLRAVEAILMESQSPDRHYIAILILGDDQIVPTCLVDSPVPDDRDVKVPSDLYLSVLSTRLPETDGEVDFGPHLMVGRIPVGNATGWALLDMYSQTVKQHYSKQPLQEQSAFGLSAEVWQEPSTQVLCPLTSDTLYLSPELDYETLAPVFPKDRQLYYFNVHGSDVEKYWYGDGGFFGGCIEVLGPEIFMDCEPGYVVGTEACYGARYIRHSKQESVLLTALSSGALGFTGSSTIAYGPASGPPGLADIMIGTFLKAVKDGMQLGDGLRVARWDLLTNESFLSPDVIKTLYQFAFYGDPLVRLNPASQKTSAKLSESKSVSSGKKILTIHQPDIFRRVRSEVDQVNRRIQEELNNRVYSQYHVFKGIPPRVDEWSFSGVDAGNSSSVLYSYTYKSKVTGPFHPELRIYVTPNGTIESEIASK